MQLTQLVRAALERVEEAAKEGDRREEQIEVLRYGIGNTSESGFKKGKRMIKSR